ncbi:cell wall hydrolase [Bacillus sp. JCM 19034]|uniref:cell wall hydrolase n=1 Tax=Bacillus sp. JCM 19034 TaxID=1481928 RepID=UPI000781BBE1
MDDKEGNSLINKIAKIICIAIVLGFVSICSVSQHSYAFSDQIIQRGATGDDVVELQARLQYIGFYDGTIDGVFGWGTYWSVRNYQDQFGMTVDGLVGPELKERLENSTQYHEEFVQKALTEGRNFTHYGTTPIEIQKGPKGSAKKGQAPQAQKGTDKKHPQEDKGQAVPPQDNRESPSPGQDQAPRQETGGQDQQPQQGGDQQTPTPPAEQGETPPTEGQGEQPEQETPPAQEEPTPYEEVPDQQDNQANIQKANNVPPGYSDNDIQIMAQAVYGEARGEPYVGQVAVAAVIINRVNSPIFPNTVSGVIFEPRAFTAVADGQIYMEPDETARRAVLDALNGQDPTGNAIYYFNPDTATSGWIWSRPQIKRIGKHIFCH